MGEKATEGAVDIKNNPDTGSSESMLEYAARREAEIRGEAPPKKATETEEKPAAVDTAAATGEKPAAATEKPQTGEVSPEDELEDSHPKKDSIKKRFADITAEKKAAQKKAEEQEAEAKKAAEKLAEVTAELERVKKVQEEAAAANVPKPEDDPEPARDKFEDPDEFLVAKTAWTTREELRKANKAASDARAKADADHQTKVEEERQAKVNEKIVQLHKSFTDRVAKAKETNEVPSDYDEKVTSNEKLTLRNDVFFMIEQAQEAPHILYHLATNPEVTAELNQLEPALAAIRIGELQAEIRIERRPKKSQAAEPVKPIRGGESPQRKKPEEMSMAEYAAMREQELREQHAAKLKRRGAIN